MNILIKLILNVKNPFQVESMKFVQEESNWNILLSYKDLYLPLT